MSQLKKSADTTVALDASTANDVWLARLRDPSSRNDAIGDLTTLLIAGLSRVFADRDGPSVAPEDIAQEAILKTLNSLDEFRGECRFTSWAMSIAVRTGLSELRRKVYQNVSLESLISEGLQVEPTTGHEVAEHQHDRKFIIRRLGELIESKLTPRQQTCIRAHLEGMPVEVIACKMNSQRNATYKLLHDARTRLRDGFQAIGIEREDIISVLAHDKERN